MASFKLRLWSCSIIFKREVISLLEKLRLKDFLRKVIVEKRSKSSISISSGKDDVKVKEKVILVLPNIPWDFRKQRPQQMFSRLAKRGFTVFYCNPITSSADGVREVSEGVYELSVRCSEHRNILREFDLSDSFVKEYVTAVKDILKKYVNTECFLFVLHPVWGRFVKGFGDCKLVYDMMDLYSGFPDAKKELVESEEELVRNSDMVVTTADSLYEYAKGLNSNVHIVKNGCDFDLFSTPKKNGLLDSLCEKPVIGYYGALNDWVDVELLKYVVSKNMDKYFVFIGAINSSKFRRLYRYSNVFFLGEVDNRDLVGYLAYFDVCTIPFVLNDLIRSTNPVKFYEYIASCRPVVSVRLPELEVYDDICYLSDTKEEFENDICKALEEDSKGLRERRKKVAMENSWDSRVDELVKVLLV